MNGKERRLEKLEKQAGIVEGISLETLVAAAYSGKPEAMHKLSKAGPNDPLLRLVLEAGNGSRPGGD